MNVNIPCPQCLMEESRKPSTVSTEMRDDGLYDFTCSIGHRTVFCVQNPKFEILFDLGVMALVNGYNREAVANTAAALERFCEFYIQVILLKHNVPTDKYQKAWKQVAVQSERQLGAFLFLYLLENKRPSNFIDTKFVKFRNDVVHKGYIPSREEAISYGEYALTFIIDTLKELWATHQEFIGPAVIADWSERVSSSGTGGGSLGFSTVIKIMLGENPFNGFRDAVEKVSSERANLLLIE